MSFQDEILKQITDYITRSVSIASTVNLFFNRALALKTPFNLKNSIEQLDNAHRAELKTFLEHRLYKFHFFSINTVHNTIPSNLVVGSVASSVALLFGGPVGVVFGAAYFGSIGIEQYRHQRQVLTNAREVLAILDKVIEADINPLNNEYRDSARKLSKLASDYYDAKAYEFCIAQYNEAIDTRMKIPPYAQLTRDLVSFDNDYWHLSLAYAKLNKHEESIAALLKAIAVLPLVRAFEIGSNVNRNKSDDLAEGMYFYHLGDEYRAINKTADAIAAYEKAIIFYETYSRILGENPKSKEDLIKCREALAQLQMNPNQAVASTGTIHNMFSAANSIVPTAAVNSDLIDTKGDIAQYVPKQG